MIESDGLLVRNVRRTDAGTYTCRARVPQTGELEERDIRLDVQVVIMIVIRVMATAMIQRHSDNADIGTANDEG